MISVIIPTVNRVLLLRHALASLAAQTHTDFEAVVVNDGGASVAAMAEWRDRFPLTMIELPTTSGPSRARNVAIEHAQGDYLAFLDDDDIFLPNHLELASRMLRSNEVDVVYLGAVVSGRRVNSLPSDWHAMHLRSYPFDERFLYVADYIHTGAVVLRNFRDSSIRFDESFSLCEDWELWLSLRHRLGYGFRSVDEVTSVYHQIAGAPGLVADGQSVTPSPFSITRKRIYSKWPVDDDGKVAEYRMWMTAFDAYCDQCVSSGRPVPARVFDRILRHLYRAFSADENLDQAVIPSFFKD